MDPAEAGQMVEILQTRDAHLNRQEEFQTAMASQLGHLTAQIQGLRDLLAPPTPTDLSPLPAPAPMTPFLGVGSKLAPPAQFSGELGLCWAFLTDCSIHFELTPHAFPTD